MYRLSSANTISLESLCYSWKIAESDDTHKCQIPKFRKKMKTGISLWFFYVVFQCFLAHLCELLASSSVCKLFKKSSPLKPLGQFKTNLAWIILRGFPLKVIHALHPRWPPLLKIEISSNGQNCFILSQNVPKFELYKHNDELFNIYCRIFYELLLILTDYAN